MHKECLCTQEELHREMDWDYQTAHEQQIEWDVHHPLPEHHVYNMTSNCDMHIALLRHQEEYSGSITNPMPECDAIRQLVHELNLLQEGL